jgi:hypothetical protein
MMHHRMPFQHISSKPHAKDKHGGGSQALFCRNIKEACEAKEHGSDSKQINQVKGSIMQAKEWTREFGRCNPMEHAVTKQQSKHECAGEKSSQEEQQATQAGRPRTVGPGRSADLPPYKHPGALLRQVSCSSSSLCVCLSS